MKLSVITLISIIVLAGCAQTKKTVITLPAHTVKGFSSTSKNLYFSGRKGATTALGQIFTPPDGSCCLNRVVFHFRKFSYGDAVSRDVNIKLRISEWENNRPASYAEWESEPLHIPADKSKGELNFKVPGVRLSANKKYIAWLTMAGLRNEASTNIGIVTMGPTTRSRPRFTRGAELSIGGTSQPIEWKPQSWHVDYPDGARAYWRENNPDGLLDNMTKLSWKMEQYGKNLRFKMEFEK